MPSHLLMTPLVKKTGKQAIATAIISGISNAKIDDETDIPEGASMLDIPRTPKMLKILLPTTLPTAISRSHPS